MFNLETGDEEVPLSRSYESLTKSISLVPVGHAPSSGKNRPYLVGITGGTASGKTSLAKEIVSRLDRKSILLLSLDSFYRPLTPSEIQQLESGEGFNFDVPSAFDVPLLKSTIKALLQDGGGPVKIPIYDFVTSSRVGWEEVLPADVIIFEGILVLYWEDLRQMMDLKLFVDTASDTRLARRILRDTRERGRTVEAILLQYERFVKPAFEMFIYPTKESADIIVPRGTANTVAVNVIVEHIQGKIARAKQMSSATNTPSKRGQDVASHNQIILSYPDDNELVEDIIAHKTEDEAKSRK